MHILSTELGVNHLAVVGVVTSAGLHVLSALRDGFGVLKFTRFPIDTPHARAVDLK
jgi:hypothetical protein